MPRLIGKQSHTGENVAALIILAAIAGVVLEYVGAINVIPGFGHESRTNLSQDQAASEHVMPHTTDQKK